MTTPKLEPGTPLPCPFCGGEPKRLNDGQGMSIFQCQNCTACHIRTFNNEAAIERWNTRHPDPRQQEKIEAAYAECRKLDASLELLGDERDKEAPRNEAD